MDQRFFDGRGSIHHPGNLVFFFQRRGHPRRQFARVDVDHRSVQIDDSKRFRAGPVVAVVAHHQQLRTGERQVAWHAWVLHGPLKSRCAQPMHVEPSRNADLTATVNPVTNTAAHVMDFGCRLSR